MTLIRQVAIVAALFSSGWLLASEEPARTVEFDDAFAVLKAHCVRCHGPALTEGGLSLALRTGIKRGGESGEAVVAGDPNNSLLWQRVSSNEMPPDQPLSEEDRQVLKDWILAGAPGLPESVSPQADGEEHWAFQKLQPSPVPEVRSSRIRNEVDAFIQARLEAAGLSLSDEAPREVLIRRVSLDLTGLPPTLEEIDQFLQDDHPDAYERMVERYLNSQRYGERWGKYWLDAAGYADSNGYFGRDSVRPHAYRYRDYVIRSVNENKPWDQFIREQIAGDELAGYVPNGEVTPEMVSLLEAVHYLRNSPDGTDASDGNPDELRADKFAVLEGTLQIMGTSLLGITIQCARCHDHKFEPFTQKDYYQLQAVIYPALNVDNWITPEKRVITTVTKAELAERDEQNSLIDQQIADARKAYQDWIRENPESGEIHFADSFDTPSGQVAENWSNIVPGDLEPAGVPPVQLDSASTPGAQILDGKLRILAAAEGGDRVLSTRSTFDWTPAIQGDWIQVTFDLVAGDLSAPYVGYFIALRDFNNLNSRVNGNVLIDGAATGQAGVYLNYPGSTMATTGRIGQSGYKPGGNYGVRITNIGDGKYELAQIVNGTLESGTVTLTEKDLPDGGFGFEYCCGRSYVIDNVLIEASPENSAQNPDYKAAQEERQRRSEQLNETIKQLEARRPGPIGQLAVFSDRSGESPKVHLLERGSYNSPGELVKAATPAALTEGNVSQSLEDSPPEHGQTTGRRLALARWLTQPDSRASSLLARVTVNRWWQHHFGRGIVATSDNLGYSGAFPTHPELLDYLAGYLIEQGWNAKAVHRLILNSATYRQKSRPSEEAEKIDPQNDLLSHYPLRRLDAEAIRDSMLAVSGKLDLELYGQPVPVKENADGDVIAESVSSVERRSVYLLQRRTQVLGLLEAFDAPSIVFNCTMRNRTTVPVQSLRLMNSKFVRQQAQAFADRILRNEGLSETEQIQLAFRIALARPAAEDELHASEEFLQSQSRAYPDGEDADRRVWIDFCHMLLASNAFLYVE